MKKKYVLAALTVLTMGITACSFAPGESAAAPESPAVSAEPTVASETGREERQETESADTEGADRGPAETKVPEESGEESLGAEEIMEGDPIVGIVDRYENDIIVIRDRDDEDLIYYFSTQDAQVIEGDTPIAAGDVVEITYRGVQGDEEHPGTAVKIVAESMMYK